jgi:hypothetical protein
MVKYTPAMTVKVMTNGLTVAFSLEKQLNLSVKLSKSG